MRERKRLRLKNFDYSSSGSYFVTMCTNNRINFFGEIVNAKMVLNKIGTIAEEYWENIQLLHPNIGVDEFVIMPDHIHGIIIIQNIIILEDSKFASPTDRTKMELCKLIQQFKRAVTIKIKSIDSKSNFKWQRSFHDRIIRNENELFNIRKYIIQNPLKWHIKK